MLPHKGGCESVVVVVVVVVACLDEVSWQNVTVQPWCNRVAMGLCVMCHR